MENRVEVGGLKVDNRLYDLVKDELAPGTGTNSESFWTSLAEIIRDLEPKNRQLLDKRDALQTRLDAWHLKRKNRLIEKDEYREFLTGIGYLVPERDAFQIVTANVDPEISQVAGPQLVVPVDNARYALNAANARWGSLYDALYGTDVIPEEEGAEQGTAYNPVRGEKVIAQTNAILDRTSAWKAEAMLKSVSFF